MIRPAARVRREAGQAVGVGLHRRARDDLVAAADRGEGAPDLEPHGRADSVVGEGRAAVHRIGRADVQSGGEGAEVAPLSAPKAPVVIRGRTTGPLAPVQAGLPSGLKAGTMAAM